MKKFLSTALILAVLAMTVTGCSNNNNSSDTSDTSDTSSVVSGDSSDTSDNESGADSEAAALTAVQMAANALNAVEWPAMMEIPDAESANLMLGIDAALCEDYYFSTQLMSAQLNEVVIAKPSAGNEEALQAQFDAHFEYIKNGAAFYPAQEESAAGAVQGKTDDGYLYILVHTDGAAVEEALLNNPPAEMPSAEGSVDEGFGVDAPSMPLSVTMADAAYGAVEWPSMMPVDDPEMILSFFGVDTTLCEDYYVANQLISAQLNEIIIVKPLAGNEDAIQAQLDAHFEYIKNDAAFYPDQEPSAAGAVMGELDNGYKYILVHADGAVVEEAVIASVSA